MPHNRNIAPAMPKGRKLCKFFTQSINALFERYYSSAKNCLIFARFGGNDVFMSRHCCRMRHNAVKPNTYQIQDFHVYIIDSSNHLRCSNEKNAYFRMEYAYYYNAIFAQDFQAAAGLRYRASFRTCSERALSRWHVERYSAILKSATISR